MFICFFALWVVLNGRWTTEIGVFGLVFAAIAYLFFVHHHQRCAELLRKEGVKCSIVSVPSEGLFRSQCPEYQEKVLPAGIKKFGLTAGLPVNLQGLVPVHEGKVWGLESFGFSAPYTVLDEKLGFTAENVYNQVKSML